MKLRLLLLIVLEEAIYVTEKVRTLYHAHVNIRKTSRALTLVLLKHDPLI